MACLIHPCPTPTLAPPALSTEFPEQEKPTTDYFSDVEKPPTQRQRQRGSEPQGNSSPTTVIITHQHMLESRTIYLCVHALTSFFFLNQPQSLFP